jgi:hypothetical protein
MHFFGAVCYPYFPVIFSQNLRIFGFSQRIHGQKPPRDPLHPTREQVLGHHADRIFIF